MRVERCGRHTGSVDEAPDAVVVLCVLSHEQREKEGEGGGTDGTVLYFPRTGNGVCCYWCKKNGRGRTDGRTNHGNATGRPAAHRDLSISVGLVKVGGFGCGLTRAATSDLQPHNELPSRSRGPDDDTVGTCGAAVCFSLSRHQVRDDGRHFGDGSTACFIFQHLWRGGGGVIIIIEQSFIVVDNGPAHPAL